jgi:hypothetical protein
MNDYEILFHACTTNYSSLAWKIKSWENSAQYALHYAVSVCTLHTIFVKIAPLKEAWNFRKIGWKTKKMCSNNLTGFFIYWKKCQNKQKP